MAPTDLDLSEVASVQHWPAAASPDLPVEAIDVSVLIPCFHITQTLRGALDSIADQRGLPDGISIEVVLVVDGVRSDAEFILALLSDKVTPFRFSVTMVELRRNLGAGLARCHGWRHCRGTLVALLDDDDIWHPDKLAIQCALHQRHPELVTSGHLYSPVYPAGFEATQQVDGHSPNSISFKRLLLQSRCPTPTLIIRRALWRDGPERFRRGEDALMKLMMASYAPIMEIPQVLACRSPAAPPLNADVHSLSRNRLRGRLSHMRNYGILVRRGRLSIWMLTPLLAWSLVLWLRRFVLDLAYRVRVLPESRL